MHLMKAHQKLIEILLVKGIQSWVPSNHNLVDERRNLSYIYVKILAFVSVDLRAFFGP